MFLLFSFTSTPLTLTRTWSAYSRCPSVRTSTWMVSMPCFCPRMEIIVMLVKGDDRYTCTSAGCAPHSFWLHLEDRNIHLSHKNPIGTAAGWCGGHKRTVQCIRHQTQRSGCCGNGRHWECRHSGTRKHRWHHPGRTLGHIGRSLHKPGCRSCSNTNLLMAEGAVPPLSNLVPGILAGSSIGLQHWAFWRLLLEHRSNMFTNVENFV